MFFRRKASLREEFDKQLVEQLNHLRETGIVKVVYLKKALILQEKWKYKQK